jgi:hypothetical protein
LLFLLFPFTHSPDFLLFVLLSSGKVFPPLEFYAVLASPLRQVKRQKAKGKGVGFFCLFAFNYLNLPNEVRLWQAICFPLRWRSRAGS